jgi:hypothetical protein
MIVDDAAALPLFYRCAGVGAVPVLGVLCLAGCCDHWLGTSSYHCAAMPFHGYCNPWRSCCCLTSSQFGSLPEHNWLPESVACCCGTRCFAFLALKHALLQRPCLPAPLRSWHPAARRSVELVVMGNSLVTGCSGHSLAQAAVCGCALLLGPHAGLCFEASEVVMSMMRQAGW